MATRNTRFISSVEHNIVFNTRNKSGFSKHLCVIHHVLYKTSFLAI